MSSALTSAQQLAPTIGTITSTQLATGKVDPNVSAAGTQINALVTQNHRHFKRRLLDDASVIASLQQQLAAAQAASTAMTPAPTAASPAGTSQTYVSAPATMALMAVSAIVGAAGGYAGKSYLDKKKGAREVQASESKRRPRKQLREGAVE